MTSADTERAARGANEVRRSGRGLAAFAVLLALAAVGLAGFPYYQTWFSPRQEPTVDALRRSQESDIASLRRALDDRLAAVDARLNQQQEALTAQLDEQNRRIESAAAAIADSKAAAASAARLFDALGSTELEFLLTAAQRRLSLEVDGRGALTLLVSAQQVLDQMSSASLPGVRSQLAEAISTLRRDPGVDVDAIFVRLEALKENLPERFPAHGFTATTPAAGAATTVWQQALDKFLSLFEIRRHQVGDGSPLSVDDAAYLRLNLELVLQTAEISLLRGDVAVYRQCLTTARSWLDDYRGDVDERIAAAQAEIDQLLALPMGHSLPDLSPMLIAIHGADDPNTAAIPALRPPDVVAPAPNETESVPVAPVDERAAAEPPAPSTNP